MKQNLDAHYNAGPVKNTAGVRRSVPITLEAPFEASGASSAVEVPDVVALLATSQMSLSRMVLMVAAVVAASAVAGLAPPA